MKKGNIHNFSAFGFPTILLLFTMICIVTFSALGLLTANSDYRLSKKYADKTRKYYTAEEQAYILISKIDHSLLEAYKKSIDRSDYYNRVSSIMTQREQGLYEIDKDNHLYHFSEQISDTQTIDITLSIDYPINEYMPFYSITQWQTNTKEILTEDNNLHLIGSDNN